MKKFFFFLFIYFIFFSKLNAFTIYDNEIEVFISDLISIIYPEDEKIDKIKFSIILEDKPNAFINKNNTIYITTGMLKYIDHVEALIGVLAHEIGHIENFHISKKKQSNDKLKLLDQLGNLTAITSAIILDQPEILLQTAISNKVGINNYYSSFSRDQEREADIFAIDRLNKLKISSEYLSNYLIFLENKSYKKGVSKESFMFATHPNYKERLNLISSFSNINYENLDQELNTRYQFIKAKLFGYTEEDFKILENKLNNESLKYGKAIMLSNKGELLNSLILINELINVYPNNYYFLETKADILYHHNFIKESKKFYEIALSNNINNNYVKKKIFEIEYENIKSKNITTANKIFLNYQNLIFILSNDLYFFKKWEKIFLLLKKDDWLMFVSAKKDLIKNNKKNATVKLESILKNSNNKILIKNSKRLLNIISYE